MGCFQAAYNVYGVLLTLSTRRSAAGHEPPHRPEQGQTPAAAAAFSMWRWRLFWRWGWWAAVLMLTFPRQLAGLLHNELAAPSIRVLAPALLAVCLLSAIRGYTQGQGQMLPTAVSQVVEFRREAGGGAGPYVVSPGLSGASPGDRGRRGHGRCDRRLTAGAAGSGPAVAALLHGQRTLRPPGGRCWVSC